MPDIHPTAVIDKQVQIADDVSVGPFSVIQGNVTLGPGCKLFHRVSLQGPLTVGANNTFYQNTSIGYAPQDMKFDPQSDGAGTLIGDNNIFREGTTISRATQDTPTTIGNDNYLMINSHLGHDVILGDNCMLANSVTIAGHVVIQDNVIMGGNAVFHQFCRIGRLAMISGMTGLSQDIPSFCTVYKNNCIGSLNVVGLRRAGLREHIKPLKQAFDLLFRKDHTNDKAIEKIIQTVGDDPLVQEFVQFVKTTKRGINPYVESGKKSIAPE